MAPHRWKEIEELFHATADIPAGDRSRFLDERSGRDLELRNEVEKLLASLDDAEEFIESPVWTDSGLLNTSAKRELSKSLDNNDNQDGFLGKQVGVYRLTREIGRGGMGAVFQAERADGEFHQTVAIKLIKRGMDTDFIVRRFRHERQILASFEHPFIARLLDGGTTTDGVPYFVMEFIEGETLFNYCDTNRLSVRDRLKLFQKICSALEYAHERQIVHRDIKPSNILINRSGSPKLLDFGIAKILDPDLIHESLNPTGSMLRMMTPDYASPEQVRGHDVASVSDIYSLGILLYELVTGYRPYVFTGRALHEVTKVVCEEMPELPSALIGTASHLLPYYAGDVHRAAEVRATTQRELTELLKRGLDDVIMKALAKEPSKRFKDAVELSKDISRVLSGTEVTAPRYRTDSPTDSRKTPATASKAIAVLPFKFLNLAAASETDDGFLGLGLADSLIARLSKLKRFLVRPTSSILAFGETLTDPIKAGKALKVNYIIDGNIKKAGDRLRVSIQLLDVEENAAIWAASIDEKLADVLYLEDSLSGKVIEALLPQLTGSEIEEFGKRGTDVPEAFEQYLRGRYYFNSFTEDGLAKAFVAFHTAIAADPNYSLAYSGVADYYNWLGIMGVLPPKECYAPAIAASKKAVELDPESSEAHAVLGFAVHAGDYDWPLAEQHLKRAVELNPGNAQAHTWYSIVLLTEGRFDEGLELARRSVELDPLTPFNFHNIGWGLYYAGRFNEAAAQYQKLMSDFPDYIFGPYGLSKVFRRSGRTKEAIRFSVRALQLMGGSIFGLLNEAEAYAADGQTDIAREKLNFLLEKSEERYVSPYHLALVHCYLKESDKAIAQLDKALEVGDPWLNWIGVEPVLDSLRSDERFRHIQENAGYRALFETAQDPTTEPTLPQEQPIHDLTTIVIDESHETSSGTNEGFSTFPKKYLYSGIALLLVLVIGIPSFLLYRNRNAEPSRVVLQQMPFQTPSVLILPFRSVESDIGAGMADALVQKLGAIKGLSVISASTGRSVANIDPDQLFMELGIPFILRGELSDTPDGSVLKADFVNATDNSLLWSESFKATTGDYFDLQSQAAERIWKTFNLDLSPTELRQAQRSYTEDPKAYTQYLIGRSQMAVRTAEGLRNAITSFSEAIRLDASFASAYVGLADAYALLNLYDRKPPENAYPMAKRFAKRALEIDESLGEAHASMAYVNFYHDRNRAAAELEFRRAIQMSPSYAQAHHWFALVLASTNKPVDALSEIQIAERLDPRSLSVKAASGIVHFFAGKNDEAHEVCDRALALQPNFLPALKVKRWIYALQGNWSEARRYFQMERSAANGKPEDAGWIVIESQLVATDSESKAAALKRLEEAAETPIIKENDFYYSFEIALAYNHLGETQKALEYIERSESSGSHSFNLVEADPRIANLRKEPRFLKVVSKLHKTD